MPDPKINKLYDYLSNKAPEIMGGADKESFGKKFSSEDSLKSLYGFIKTKRPELLGDAQESAFVNKFKENESSVYFGIPTKSQLETYGFRDVFANLTQRIPLEEAKQKRKESYERDYADASTEMEQASEIIKDKTKPGWERQAAYTKLLGATAKAKTNSEKVLKEFESFDEAEVEKTVAHYQYAKSKTPDDPDYDYYHRIQKESLNKISEWGKSPAFKTWTKTRAAERLLQATKYQLFPNKEKEDKEIQELQRQTDIESKSVEGFEDKTRERLKLIGNDLQSSLNSIATTVGSALWGSKIAENIIGKEEATKRRTNLLMDATDEKLAAKKPTDLKGFYKEPYVKLSDGTKVVVDEGNIAYARDDKGFQKELTEDQIYEAQGLIEDPKNIKEADLLGGNYKVLGANFQRVVSDFVVQMALTRGLGAAGMTNKMLTVGIPTAALSMGNYYVDAVKKGASENEAFGIAALKASADGVLENIGGLEGKIAGVGVADDVLKRTRADVRRSILDGAVPVKDALPFYFKLLADRTKGAVRDGIGEVFEEVAQGISQDTADNLFLGQEKNVVTNQLKNLEETFIHSFGIGAGASSIRNIYNSGTDFRNNVHINAIDQLIQDPETAERMINESPLPPEQKSDLRKQLVYIEHELSAREVGDKSRLQATGLAKLKYEYESQLTKAKVDGASAKAQEAIQIKIDEIDKKLDRFGAVRLPNEDAEEGTTTRTSPPPATEPQRRESTPRPSWPNIDPADREEFDQIESVLMEIGRKANTINDDTFDYDPEAVAVMDQLFEDTGFTGQLRWQDKMTSLAEKYIEIKKEDKEEWGESWTNLVNAIDKILGRGGEETQDPYESIITGLFGEGTPESPDIVEASEASLKLSDVLGDLVSDKDGNVGTLDITPGGVVEFETDGQIRELGNTADLGDVTLSEFGLKRHLIEGDESGSKFVSGSTIYTLEDPKTAVVTNETGQVDHVRVITQDGIKEVRGPEAQELAYKIKLRELYDRQGEQETRRQIESAMEQVPEPASVEETGDTQQSEQQSQRRALPGTTFKSTEGNEYTIDSYTTRGDIKFQYVDHNGRVVRGVWEKGEFDAFVEDGTLSKIDKPTKKPTESKPITRKELNELKISNPEEVKKLGRLALKKGDRVNVYDKDGNLVKKNVLVTAVSPDKSHISTELGGRYAAVSSNQVENLDTNSIAGSIEQDVSSGKESLLVKAARKATTETKKPKTAKVPKEPKAPKEPSIPKAKQEGEIEPKPKSEPKTESKEPKAPKGQAKPKPIPKEISEIEPVEDINSLTDTQVEDKIAEYEAAISPTKLKSWKPNIEQVILANRLNRRDYLQALPKLTVLLTGTPSILEVSEAIKGAEEERGQLGDAPEITTAPTYEAAAQEKKQETERVEREKKEKSTTPRGFNLTTANLKELGERINAGENIPIKIIPTNEVHLVINNGDVVIIDDKGRKKLVVVTGIVYRQSQGDSGYLQVRYPGGFVGSVVYARPGVVVSQVDISNLTFKSQELDIFQQVENVLKSLSKIIPDIEINILFDDEYNSQIDQTSRGKYVRKDGKVTLYINADKANKNTVFHEAAHAVFEHFFNTQDKRLLVFHQIAKSALGKKKTFSPEWTSIIEQLEAFSNSYEDGIPRSREYLVELVSLLSANKETLSKEPFFIDRMVRVLNTFFRNLLGIAPLEKESDISDVIELLNSIAMNLVEGQTISESIIPESINRLGQRLGEVPNTSDISFESNQLIGQTGANQLDISEGEPNRQLKLRDARELEKLGYPALDILRMTGWQKDNGEWVYETSDFNAQFRLDKSVTDVMEALALDGIYPTLEEVIGINAPVLNAYPRLRTIKIKVDNNLGKRGTSDLSNGIIHLNLLDKEGFRFSPLELAKTLVHEVQHFVQAEEFFEQGGTQAMFTQTALDMLKQTKEYQDYIEEKVSIRNANTGNLIKLRSTLSRFLAKQPGIVQAAEFIKHGQRIGLSPKDMYQRMAGEVQARNVSKRFELTEDQRREVLLSETSDTREEDKIYLDDLSRFAGDIVSSDTRSDVEFSQNFGFNRDEILENLRRRRGFNIDPNRLYQVGKIRFDAVGISLNDVREALGEDPIVEEPVEEVESSDDITYNTFTNKVLRSPRTTDNLKRFIRDKTPPRVSFSMEEIELLAEEFVSTVQSVADIRKQFRILKDRWSQETEGTGGWQFFAAHKLQKLAESVGDHKLAYRINSYIGEKSSEMGRAIATLKVIENRDMLIALTTARANLPFTQKNEHTGESVLDVMEEFVTSILPDDSTVKEFLKDVRRRVELRVFNDTSFSQKIDVREAFIKAIRTPKPSSKSAVNVLAYALSQYRRSRAPKSQKREEVIEKIVNDIEKNKLTLQELLSVKSSIEKGAYTMPVAERVNLINTIEDIIADVTNKPFGYSELRKEIRNRAQQSDPKAKNLNDVLVDIARDRAKNETFGKSLIEDIMGRTGLKEPEASKYASDIQRAFDSILAEEVQKKIERAEKILISRDENKLSDVIRQYNDDLNSETDDNKKAIIRKKIKSAQESLIKLQRRIEKERVSNFRKFEYSQSALAKAREAVDNKRREINEVRIDTNMSRKDKSSKIIQLNKQLNDLRATLKTLQQENNVIKAQDRKNIYNQKTLRQNSLIRDMEAIRENNALSSAEKELMLQNKAKELEKINRALRVYEEAEEKNKDRAREALIKLIDKPKSRGNLMDIFKNKGLEESDILSHFNNLYNVPQPFTREEVAQMRLLLDKVENSTREVDKAKATTEFLEFMEDRIDRSKDEGYTMDLLFEFAYTNMLSNAYTSLKAITLAAKEFMLHVPSDAILTAFNALKKPRLAGLYLKYWGKAVKSGSINVWTNRENLFNALLKGDVSSIVDPADRAKLLGRGTHLAKRVEQYAKIVFLRDGKKSQWEKMLERNDQNKILTGAKTVLGSIYYIFSIAARGLVVMDLGSKAFLLPYKSNRMAFHEYIKEVSDDSINSIVAALDNKIVDNHLLENAVEEDALYLALDSEGNYLSGQELEKWKNQRRAELYPEFAQMNSDALAASDPKNINIQNSAKSISNTLTATGSIYGTIGALINPMIAKRHDRESSNAVKIVSFLALPFPRQMGIMLNLLQKTLPTGILQTKLLEDGKWKFTEEWNEAQGVREKLASLQHMFQFRNEIRLWKNPKQLESIRPLTKYEVFHNLVMSIFPTMLMGIALSYFFDFEECEDGSWCIKLANDGVRITGGLKFEAKNRRLWGDGWQPNSVQIWNEKEKKFDTLFSFKDNSLGGLLSALGGISDMIRLDPDVGQKAEFNEAAGTFFTGLSYYALSFGYLNNLELYSKAYAAIDPREGPLRNSGKAGKELIDGIVRPFLPGDGFLTGLDHSVGTVVGSSPIDPNIDLLGALGGPLNKYIGKLGSIAGNMALIDMNPYQDYDVMGFPVQRVPRTVITPLLGEKGARREPRPQEWKDATRFEEGFNLRYFTPMASVKNEETLVPNIPLDVFGQMRREAAMFKGAMVSRLTEELNDPELTAKQMFLIQEDINGKGNEHAFVKVWLDRIPALKAEEATFVTKAKNYWEDLRSITDPSTHGRYTKEDFMNYLHDNSLQIKDGKLVPYKTKLLTIKEEKKALKKAKKN